MEYAGRHSMEGILRKKENKRLSETDAKRYFQQILSAVACCHRHNISHRDIKL
jgi:carbon catabolite-derepressing protein kinase